MLKDTDYIPSIMDFIDSNFLQLDKRDKQIYFTACVYYFFCPASYVGKNVQKLPIGIRDEAARVLGYENPENVNALRNIAEVYMKSPVKRGYIEQVKDYFKQYSVRGMDWELGL